MNENTQAILIATIVVFIAWRMDWLQPLGEWVANVCYEIGDFILRGVDWLCNTLLGGE